jgi:hypothetical protein
MTTFEQQAPSLYGLVNTNVDFSSKDAWGKNKFNNTFPAALCCYLEHLGLGAVYLKLGDSGTISQDTISIPDLFRVTSSLDPDIYFSFETEYAPFQPLVYGSIERNDLVIRSNSTPTYHSSLEIKLTALPDNSTCTLNDNEQGCEIVVRPTTICYLACSIAYSLNEMLRDNLQPIELTDWTDPQEVCGSLEIMHTTLRGISNNFKDLQSPILLQPIWKTVGKSPKLADYCLDVFCWSDMAFLSFILDISVNSFTTMNRQGRTVAWIYKILQEITINRRFDFKRIVNELTYNVKNDKAFAANGSITHRFMSCERLTAPAISKNEIKNIVLNGGQNYLSPERRFDSIIHNDPELFN